MNEFNIFPAIDLHQGQVVRLEQGSLDKQTTYSNQPAESAQRWINQGASWIHVVNLDGAFGKDQQANIHSLRKVLQAANGSAKIQFGGGLRDLASIAFALEMGIERVVIGTAAVKNPDLMHGALHTFGPEKIILGVDARDGLVRVAGWQEGTEITPQALIQQFQEDHLHTAIFTNISRDGMGSGPDIAAAKTLAQETGVNIIASGGVHSIADIQAVRRAGLSGVIVGKALYQKQFTLREALSC